MVIEEILWQGAQLVIAGCLGIVSYFIKRNFSQLDAFRKRLNLLEGDFKAMRRDVDKLDGIEKGMEQLRQTVAINAQQQSNDNALLKQELSAFVKGVEAHRETMEAMLRGLPEQIRLSVGAINDTLKEQNKEISNNYARKSEVVGEIKRVDQKVGNLYDTVGEMRQDLKVITTIKAKGSKHD